MNPRISKLRGELEKNTQKISKLQARNTELKQQIQELENLDIVDMVRACGMTPENLATLLQQMPSAPGKEAASYEE